MEEFSVSSQYHPIPIQEKDIIMEVTEQNQVAEQYRYMEEDESDAQEWDSDDSEEDPTFDVVEETRSSFSTLSIKKKSKSP